MQFYAVSLEICLCVLYILGYVVHAVIMVMQSITFYITGSGKGKNSSRGGGVFTEKVGVTTLR